MYTVQKHQAAGRKLKPGKWVIDQSTGRTGIFVGYCDGCESKHFITREAVNGMMKYIYTENSSLKQKLLKVLLKSHIA